MQRIPILNAVISLITERLGITRLRFYLSVGSSGLLAAPVTRQIASDHNLSTAWIPLVWLGVSAAFFLIIMAISKAMSRMAARLQEKSRVFKYYMLLQALVVRDIRARYARSSLGWLWILLQPLIQMVVFTGLRYILGMTPSKEMHFALFLFTAILPWNFIVNTITTSAPAVFSNADLLKKMPVPREIFVFSAVAAAFVDFLMGMVILIVMMTLFAVPLTLSLLWFPVLLLIALGFSVAMGLLVSAISPFRSDINLAIPYCMQLWFFMTPVFYSLELVPDFAKTIISINPMVGLITGFRAVLGAGLPPELGPLAWSAGFTIILLALSWPFFRHMSQHFADML